MNILVCVASRHGATEQIGAAIAASLRGNGVPADVRAPEQVADLQGYDALVLGSAVYMGRWLRGARDLVDRVSGQLDGRPVWLFSSGPIGEMPGVAEEPRSPVDVARIEKATAAREHRVFGGRLERARLGVVHRTVTAAMHLADRDDRDWDEIAAWGGRIAEQLRSAAGPGPGPRPEAGGAR